MKQCVKNSGNERICYFKWGGKICTESYIVSEELLTDRQLYVLWLLIVEVTFTDGASARGNIPLPPMFHPGKNELWYWSNIFGLIQANNKPQIEKYIPLRGTTGGLCHCAWSMADSTKTTQTEFTQILNVAKEMLTFRDDLLV